MIVSETPQILLPSPTANEDSNYYSDDESSNQIFNTIGVYSLPQITINGIAADSLVHNSESHHDEGLDEMVCSVLQLQSGPESIMYRGEGNSSLVVALPKDGKVIRILKGKLEKCHSSSSHDTNCPLKDGGNKLAAKLVKDRLEDFIDFHRNVLRRLFNNSFLNLPQMVFLNKSQVDVIRQVATTCRPDHRLNKSIAVGETYALLLPDFCTLNPSIRNRYPLEGPVISVEIKPKQGFLPSADTLPRDLNEKSRVSRFCLKQFHKLKKGTITKRSEYCPLDLFSGCRGRQMLALRCLLKTAQNNLRIFKDLQLVYGDGFDGDHLSTIFHDLMQDNQKINQGSEDSETDKFCQLILDALMTPVKRHIVEQEEMIRIEDAVCELHPDHSNQCDTSCDGHFISSLSVLGSVYGAQKLDSVDSHGALEMARYLSQRIPNLMTELKSKERRPPSIGSPQKLTTESLEEYFFRKLWEFVVSLTAKDCSIMITLQRVTKDFNRNEEMQTKKRTCLYEDSDSSCDVDSNPQLPGSLDQNLMRDTSGNLYAVSVAITDLDPKLPETFADMERKMREKDYLMIASFNQSKPS